MPETRGGKKTGPGASCGSASTELARATGEERGGLKQVTTQVGGQADKLNRQGREQAARRQEELRQTRQIHTPKAGTKSEGGTPIEQKLEKMGYRGEEAKTEQERRAQW